MNSFINNSNLILAVVIVPKGMGSKIVHSGMDNGLSGGTILYGTGIAHSFVSHLVGGLEAKKEIVLMAGPSDTVKKCIQILKEKFGFDKLGAGIAFTTSVCGIFGTTVCNCDNIENEGDMVTMHKLIMTIVDKGKSAEVVEAAIKCGASGGTVVGGRGSGLHETQKVFSMYIEPEKEIIMIVAKTEKVKTITDSISRQLNLDEEGKGIIFVLNVNEAYGLYREDQEE